MRNLMPLLVDVLNPVMGKVIATQEGCSFIYPEEQMFRRYEDSYKPVNDLQLIADPL